MNIMKREPPFWVFIVLFPLSLICGFGWLLILLEVVSSWYWLGYAATWIIAFTLYHVYDLDVEGFAD